LFYQIWILSLQSCNVYLNFFFQKTDFYIDCFYFLADIYSPENIITDLPTQPENEEKTRKIGCWIACILKRQNLVSVFKYAIRILYVYNVQQCKINIS